MSGAPGSTISLHLLGITNDGRVWHSSQSEDALEGSWHTWEEVRAPGLQQPGPFVHVDCVSTETADGKEEVHVLGTTQDAKLWYTSRVEGQNWQPFEDLTTRIGNPGHFVFARLKSPTSLNAPSGGGPGCPDIQMSLANDNSQMQGLQMQAASTTNNALLAQLNQQIAGLQQDIASLQQQARDRNC